MAHDVLMPQLGMAQDTAVLVSWAKSVGDAVKAGDILMEVETDKSTVEVEASHDGFLIDIRAAAGAEVPVGDVIGIISSNVDDAVVDVVEAPPVSESESEPDSQQEIMSQSQEKLPAQPQTARQSLRISVDRILASPKAKVEAKRSGIDLALMVQNGASQPVHYQDVVTAANVVSSAVASVGQPSAAQSRNLISLKVPRKPLDEFAHWLESERPGEINPAALWMSMLTRAIRASFGYSGEDEIRAAFWAIGSQNEKLSSANADLSLLSAVQLFPSKSEVLAEIIDLRRTALSKIELGNPSCPISLVFKTTTKNFKIQCSFDSQSITPGVAICFSSEISRLLANPVLLLV